MEYKAKWNCNPPCILGITFSFIGAVYLPIGLGLLGNTADADSLAVGSVFLPLGAVFLLVGMACLALCLYKKKTADRLLEDGHYIWGNIVKFDLKRNINLVNSHPSVAIVHYRDSVGKLHVFQSRYIYRGLDPTAVGKAVRVYVADETCKQYYVDVEPVLKSK